MTFTFPAAVAWDPSGNKPVKNASFQVYATTDTSYTNPLPITDPFGNALPGNILNSGTQGVFPQFQQATNAAVVIADSTRTYAWTVNAAVVDANYVPTAQKGAASGIATLDGGSKIPVAQVPDLSTTYLKLGHTDYLTATAPMIELATNSGSGRIFHLLSGAGSTSEIAGVGVDNPGSQGFTFSLKSTGNIGIGVNLETTSGSDSIGILGANLSSGKIVELRKGSQNGGVLVSLRADYGGSGTLFQWGLPGTSVAATLTVAGSTVNATAHGLPAGQRLTFSAITGTTGISNGTTYYVVNPTANAFQVAATLGGTAITFGGTNGTANYVAADNLNGYIDAADGSLVQQSGNTNPSKVRTSTVSGGTQQAHYVYSGTAGLWFPNAVSTASNSFRLQQGNAAAIGSETMTTLIELKNANSIGFYGVAPVARAAAIASPASDTSGTKAAIDAIRAALTNIGITL